ncbi:hypothetical protein Tco_0328095 [Tanacetum coccineum]
MSIYAKALLFLWAKVVAITCYIQNHSVIRLCYEKTPYELLHDRKSDLSYLHEFGALCYPTNASEDLGKLNAKADVGIFIEYVLLRKLIGYTTDVQDELWKQYISRFVPQPPSPTPFFPPTRIDWDTLFQPLFDEYFNPLPSVDYPVPEVVAPKPTVSTGTPSSTSVDQDAPSPKPCSKESSSQVVIPNNLHLVNQQPKHISKWTKDHPIDNVIGDPSRQVSTWHQLQTKALFCYLDAFISSVKPKSYKEALTESCWIEAIFFARLSEGIGICFASVFSILTPCVVMMPIDHALRFRLVNNLPPYWAKYVTNVKNNKDISATTYVELYTYLKSYEPHAMKTLKKQEQSTNIVDSLAYLA